MDRLTKCNNTIERAIVTVAGVIFVIMLCSCSWQVFSRYVLRNASTWSEELSRFCMCYVAMLGSAILFRHKSHVAMTLLSGKIKNKTALFVLNMVDSLIISVFLYFMTRYGWRATVSASRQISTVLKVNYSLVYACVPIAGALMLWFNLESIVGLINDFWQGGTERSNEA